MKSRLLPRLTAPTILLALALASTARGQVVTDSIDVGGAWVGSLAYNPLMDVVYGGSQLRDGTFFAIDCATNQVIESWPIQWTMGMDYDSIDHRLYCAYGLDAESLAVIDGRTHQRIKAIPLEWARLCVWDGMRDRLYVSCPERNVVAVFDCTQDSLICEIPVGNYPLKMYLSGWHKKLYVLNYDGRSVTIVNTVNNQVIREVPLDIYPGAGLFAEGADNFYCCCLEGVAVLDGSTDSLVARVSLPDGGWATSFAENPDLGRILVGSNGYPRDLLCVLDSGGDTLIGTLHLGRSMDAVYWSPSSGLAYVTQDAGYVSVVSGDGRRLMRNLPMGDSPFAFSYSPKHGRVYVSDLNTRYVYVIRDEVGGIAESGSTRLPRGAATLVRGVLNVPRDMTDFRSGKSDRVPRPRAVLLDASGRRVLDLVPGPNDVSHLSPGVYFVAAGRGVTRRVVRVR